MEDLAWRSDLVITTFQRLSIEKRGFGAASPLMRVRVHLGRLWNWVLQLHTHSKRDDVHARFMHDNQPCCCICTTHARDLARLMQVHWLRVILDEGHLLGAGLAMTNKLQTARALHAERRWVMTGTPTPNKPTAHVAHLQPLLDFLRQQPYGTQRKLWEVGTIPALSNTSSGGPCASTLFP